ncbi:hypothetical protein [Glaciihabitans sp. dw_435]|uniref:hypothetical protein n=1 Tax=Glaciihabitans sp. dw_435 TaxID=2720081 RepID=UPI001BD688A6|nr:hypothetical protein [Glaciihabitans sp. dw_435]
MRNHLALKLRTVVRGTLFTALLLFIWYSLSRVQAMTADALPLAGISSLLLVLLLVAISRKTSRS